MNKRKFNEFFRIKTKNNSMTAQTYFNLQYHPTFHSEKRLVNVVRGRECALLVYLYYQSKNAEDTIYTVHPSFRLCMYCIIYCYTMHQNYENLNKFPELVAIQIICFSLLPVCCSAIWHIKELLSRCKWGKCCLQCPI